MSISELFRKAEFLVDAKGAKKAVVLDHATWDERKEPDGFCQCSDPRL